MRKKVAIAHGVVDGGGLDDAVTIAIQSLSRNFELDYATTGPLSVDVYSDRYEVTMNVKERSNASN